jgi:hypothetical protein
MSVEKFVPWFADDDPRRLGGVEGALKAASGHLQHRSTAYRDTCSRGGYQEFGVARLVDLASNWSDHMEHNASEDQLDE